ncbi:hypothetical protein [Roseateles sp.]|uniref:hypothetical protein n=1 Tax=Roseateles sp. TaxID=1971397 RepID=UPI0031D5AA4A
MTARFAIAALRSRRLLAACLAAFLTLDVVTVEGQMTVLSDDPCGMFYRVTQAMPAAR